MGIGFLELVIIAVVALVLLGPEKLPQVLQQVGRFYVQLRRTSSEFRSVFDHMVHKAEEELRLEEIKRLTKLVEESKKSEDTHLSAAGNVDAAPAKRSEGAMDGWEASHDSHQGAQVSDKKDISSTDHKPS